MSTLNIGWLEGRPILDLRSYGRRGPGRRDRLSSAEIAQVSRTVRRVPEVVVKVLPSGSNNLAAIARHIGYIGRQGDLELETDDGERVRGRSMGRALLDDFDLDLDEHRGQPRLDAALGRKPPKLVHKLMLSMPPGTSVHGVLAAARNFLRDEFALKHRYAFVLHTDEPHPHVHVVVKAVSEQGVRLNIRKATLREWRMNFARHLRRQGVEANATERAVRGESRASKRDGIYRATDRGASTHMLDRTAAVAGDLQRGYLHVEPGMSKLVRTRTEVERGWHALSEVLASQGQPDLSKEIMRFLREMSPPRTEKEHLAVELLERVRQQRVKDRLRNKV